MPETILDRIVASTRQRLAATPAPAELSQLARKAASRRKSEGAPSFRAALSTAQPAIIAECKKASPSAGVLREAFYPESLARSYEAGGAAAISVVTEPEHFQGDPMWIAQVRRVTRLPILRKDFIVEARQIEEAVVLGADAVLLIQRILTSAQLDELIALAHSLGIDVLLELFADEDPAPAISSAAAIIGVNARDLATFELDLERVAALAQAIPEDRIKVAESGIRTRDDVTRLRHAGYTAFLVGEHLVRSINPEQMVAELARQ